MTALLELSWKGDTGLYVWTGILIVIIMGIAIPLTMYEQRVVKSRWKTVSQFVQEHMEQVKFRTLEQKEGRDILLPIFSGFLIHGNFTYICLDPEQNKQQALSFIEGLRAVC